MNLDRLPTPSLILDWERAQQNIARMRERLAARGVPLRPHVKTCKSLPVVEAMLEGQPGGITVSTLREASFFAEQGIRDITYAVSMAPGKLNEAARLVRDGADLKLLLESRDMAERVAEFGHAEGVCFKVLIEIDSDGHRAGLDPDNHAVTDIGKVLHESEGSSLCGVLTHAGSSYGCQSTDEITDVAEQECAAVVRAATRLREADLPCPVVSMGSSPTAALAQSLDGITEVRAGVYVFQDLFQVWLGVADYDDMALAVLAEVTGTDPDTRRVFIDAGALALSKDRSTAAAGEDFGFGLVSRPGEPPADGQFIVSQVFQEHGVLTPRFPDASADDYRPGERVLIWPNHACMTAAAHETYFVVDANKKTTTTWSRINGW